ncbi:MAG: ATPase domain-containing protein [Methanomassiliicoccales archaeon]
MTSGFCPVCGYAMKRGETQCGRCGEIVEDTSVRQVSSRQHSNSSDYSIESIGVTYERLPADKGIKGRSMGAESSGQGMRTAEVSDLKAYVSELEKRIASIDSEDGSQSDSNSSGPSTRTVSRNDPRFIATVASHTQRMRKLGRRLPSAATFSYLPFPDERVVSPGVPRNSMILMAGPPGTGKTSFTLACISAFMKKEEGKLIYLLLGDTLRNLSTHASTLPEESAHFIDISDLRSETGGEKESWTQLAVRRLEEETKRLRAKYVVVDTINALTSMSSVERPRKFAFDIFERFRRIGVTAFIIREGDYVHAVRSRYAEAFLADGVVQFLAKGREDGGAIRMFRVIKMRGAEIDSRFFSIHWTSRGMVIMPAIQQ